MGLNPFVHLLLGYVVDEKTLLDIFQEESIFDGRLLKMLEGHQDEPLSLYSGESSNNVYFGFHIAAAPHMKEFVALGENGELKAFTSSLEEMANHLKSELSKYKHNLPEPRLLLFEVWC